MRRRRVAKMGPRFVDVPADRLMEKLDAIGAKVEGKGGRYITRRQGHEKVVDLVLPGGKAMVTCYTSLAEGADAVRDCGEDAVRVVVSVQMPEGVVPLEDGQKILRTAPRDEEDRVATFLERLEGELRKAYHRAFYRPTCSACGAAMAERETKATPKRKFFGCVRFPSCKGTHPWKPWEYPAK